MASLYDSADIYDLFESERKYAATRRHWETVLAGKSVRSALDVSIGTGGLTLPLAEMGVRLYGSDLSEAMLARCREKAAVRGVAIDLRACDFRELTAHFDRKFDCVMSTGNSLAHVANDDVCRALEQMDALVESGGTLYFDLRNWDKILRERKRFYLYNPVFDGNVRINLVQVWDYHADGTMTFNLLYTFERENRIVKVQTFDEQYYPVQRQLLLDKLTQMGYGEIRVMAFPADSGIFEPEQTDWYCVTAQKRP